MILISRINNSNYWLTSEKISRCPLLQNLLSVKFCGMTQCSNWERKYWYDSSLAKNHNQYENPQISYIYSAPPQRNSNQCFIFLFAFFTFPADRYKGSNLSQWNLLTKVWDFFFFLSILIPGYSHSLTLLNYISLIRFNHSTLHHISYIPFLFISFSPHSLLFF